MLRSVNSKKKNIKICCAYNLHNLEEKINLRWDSLENTMQVLLSGQTENALNSLNELQENEKRKQDNYPLSPVHIVIDLFESYPLQICISMEKAFSLKYALKILDDQHMTDVQKSSSIARKYAVLGTFVVAKTASDYLVSSYFSTKNEKENQDCHLNKKNNLEIEEIYVHNGFAIKANYSDCRVNEKTDVTCTLKQMDLDYVFDENPYYGLPKKVFDEPRVSPLGSDSTDVCKSNCGGLQINNEIRPTASSNNNADSFLLGYPISSKKNCHSKIEKNPKPLSCELKVPFYCPNMYMSQPYMSNVGLSCPTSSLCYLN